MTEQDKTQTVAPKPKAFKETLQIALNCTRTFREIMEQETQALMVMDFATALQIGDRKKEYAGVYADSIEALVPFAQQMKQLPEQTKAVFRDEKIKFDDVVNRNKKELEKASGTTKRLSERIIDVTRRMLVRDGVNYGSNGMAKQAQLRPMHMSVNETL